MWHMVRIVEHASMVERFFSDARLGAKNNVRTSSGSAPIQGATRLLPTAAATAKERATFRVKLHIRSFHVEKKKPSVEYGDAGDERHDSERSKQAKRQTGHLGGKRGALHTPAVAVCAIQRQD